MELVTGAVALGSISIFSGVNVQDDWSGSPEHESVTNIGAVRDEAFTGVSEAVSDPDWPCFRERVAGETPIEKSGVVPVTARTGVTCDTEVKCVVSPM